MLVWEVLEGAEAGREEVEQESLQEQTRRLVSPAQRLAAEMTEVVEAPQEAEQKPVASL